MSTTSLQKPRYMQVDGRYFGGNAVPVDVIPVALEVYGPDDSFLFCNELFRRLFPECRDLLTAGTSPRCDRGSQGDAGATHGSQEPRPEWLLPEPRADAGMMRSLGFRTPIRRHNDGRCFLFLENKARDGTRVCMHYDISDQARETAALEARNSELMETIRTLNDNQAELAAEVARTRSLQAQLRRRAEFDSTSGLANRDSFYARCDEEMMRCRLSGACASVTFLDIDGFKMINDTFGHLGGDAVITKVGRILAAARRSGDFAGRIGGDEFAILLPGTSLDEPSSSRDAFARSWSARESRYKIERARSNSRRALASRNFRQPTRPSRISSNAADKGLYAAKQKGRNCVVAWSSPGQGA